MNTKDSRQGELAASTLSRTPPSSARRTLREEVGFRCPVPDCGNPYLYWHHFDPRWEERQHHEPEGMIALCAIHHAKADAGTFTKEQLREFKQRGRQSAEEIKGRFDWMRRDLLAVVGGNFYIETPIILQFRGSPAIWFNHDDKGYLLLNLRMLTTSDEPRAQIEDNCWLALGTPTEVTVRLTGGYFTSATRTGMTSKSSSSICSTKTSADATLAQGLRSGGSRFQ